jgi:hypothetical protein
MRHPVQADPFRQSNVVAVPLQVGSALLQAKAHRVESVVQGTAGWIH